MNAVTLAAKGARAGQDQKIKSAARSGHWDLGEDRHGRNKEVTYKGYTIQAVPDELLDLGQWGVNLFMSWPTARGEKRRHFSTSDQYTTQQEAAARCITYGEQLIDGKIQGIVL